MICLTCGRYLSGDAELERETGGLCQCPRLTPAQMRQAAAAKVFLKPVPRDSAEDMDDPDYDF